MTPAQEGLYPFTVDWWFSSLTVSLSELVELPGVEKRKRKKRLKSWAGSRDRNNAQDAATDFLVWIGSLARMAEGTFFGPGLYILGR